MRRAILCSLLSVSVAAPVAAQEIAPKVMVLFDTSGSMLWDTRSNATHGDGSVDHPGVDTNGDRLPNDSKLFVAKEAVRDILLDSDADIEFGLMRFHQSEGVNILDEGPNSTRYREPINYTGWGACDAQDGGADVLVGISPTSRRRILGWMDGRETFPSDKELRGTGWTPLAESLTDARDYYRDDAIATDPQRDCRAYYLIVLTDGVRECPQGTPNLDPAVPAAQLRTVRVNGRDHDVKTFVIGFGPNVDGAEQLNQMARAGGTATNEFGAIDLVAGTALFATDRARLRQVLGEVIVSIQPVELCDGRDNDCDGRVDEDFPTLGDRCDVGIGECARTGEIVCTDSGTSVECDERAGPRGQEVCDGVDNDCDGLIDEGTLNACGTCGAAPRETCDGIDNDCDGDVDEGTLNRCGRCGAVPTETCNGIDDDCDGLFDEDLLNACGECGPPPVEVCDGLDNDCDNIIDEGFPENCGDCVPRGDEVCNGMDDDCDNLIDEGVQNDCGECGPVPPEVCNGRDDDCDGDIDEGVEEACGGCELPPAEECNGRDDDCDGDVDEGTFNDCGFCGDDRRDDCDNVDNDCDGDLDDIACPDPQDRCVNGECAEPCQQGECFGGTVCREGFCVTPCNNSQCRQGWVCQHGACADPCVGIDCPAGRACSFGMCVDASCTIAGCPGDQVCVGDACVDDACADANCGPDQACRDGRCIDTCLGIQCPPGQRCGFGECFDDECAGRTCPGGRICVDGDCVDDPCNGVQCPGGQVCDYGDCVDDPCPRTHCPDGTHCEVGECVTDVDNTLPATDDEGGGAPGGNNGEGGGGATPGAGPQACSCRTPAAPVTRVPVWLAALALLFLRITR